jgi:DNA-binding transcriptional ArsR family regulator
MADSRVSIDRLFHALGDPTRRSMVEKLSAGPMSASSLAAPLDITLTAVVQHLKVLEECGLVRTEKLGRVRTCSLDPAGLSILDQWIKSCRSLWEERFDRLGEMLAEPEDTK